MFIPLLRESLHSRATAIKLNGLGAKLALTDIDGSSAHTTRELCGQDQNHYGGVMNVADEADVVSRVGDIVGSFGHLDHVFNCAGVNPTAMSLVDTPSAYFDKLVGVNLKGVCKWTRKAVGRHAHTQARRHTECLH